MLALWQVTLDPGLTRNCLFAGTVWEAFNILTGLRVAIKTHQIPIDTALPPILPYEVKMYDILRDCEGIPRIHWSGVDGNHHVAVMDLLSPNLSALRRLCRGTFTLRTICMLAEQMVYVRLHLDLISLLIQFTSFFGFKLFILEGSFPVISSLKTSL